MTIMPNNQSSIIPLAPQRIIPEAHYVFPVKKIGREARIFQADGERGSGKTRATVEYLVTKYVHPPPASGKKPRRGVIIDINDEYGEFGIQSIPLDRLAEFCVHPKIELRRIRPYLKEKDGFYRKMSVDEMLKALNVALDTFKGGALLMEDITKLMPTHIDKDVIGAIISNRHFDCDLMLHYQNVNRPLPAIWENTNVVRFHHQKTNVYKAEHKIENIGMFRIAQILVDQKVKTVSPYYFVHLDIDKGKIYGDFVGKDFYYSIQEMVCEKPQRYINPLLAMTDSTGTKKYNYETAVKEITKKIFIELWGNTPLDMTKIKSIFP